MTVPSYTEDLTDIATGDEAAGWVELTGTAGGESYNTGGGTPAYEDNEYPYIQGLYAVTQDCTKSGLNVASMAYSSGGITVPTDGAVFVWHNFSSPFAMNIYSIGGMCIGSGLADFDVWYVGGRDKESYPYGGFLNHVVNPTITADDTAGTPTGTLDYVGSAIYYDGGPSKGEPHQVDVMRYGRGSAIFEFGELANYCTIDGFALENDNQTNRWALIQETSGGYLWKGRMQLGTVSNAVDFRDTNKTIFVQWTPKVTANFNTIEIINASSNIEMTGFQFICLDTSTASPGRWITTNNATVVLTTCSFIDLGSFTLDTNSDFLGCTWTRCGLVTVAGGVLNGSSVLASTVAVDASAVNWNVATDPDGYLDDLTISEGTNSHHAIEFGLTSPTTMTINNLDVGGDFAATNYQSNSTFYVARTTGTVTINCVGCVGNMTYDSAGADVIIVSDPVTVKATVTATTGVPISGALVYIAAKDDTGPFPFEEVVTGIVNSGTLATVTHTGHGMASGDYVHIYGASLAANDGNYQITVTDVDTYTYIMLSTPGSSPTGTITSTFIALYGLTNVDGVKSANRVYPSDQPITGWARKSSINPYYKEGSISGEVSSIDGLTATAVLVLDE